MKSKGKIVSPSKQKAESETKSKLLNIKFDQAVEELSTELGVPQNALRHTYKNDKGNLVEKFSKYSKQNAMVKFEKTSAKVLTLGSIGLLLGSAAEISLLYLISFWAVAINLTAAVSLPVSLKRKKNSQKAIERDVADYKKRLYAPK